MDRLAKEKKKLNKLIENALKNGEVICNNDTIIKQSRVVDELVKKWYNKNIKK